MCRPPAPAPAAPLCSTRKGAKQADAGFSHPITLAYQIMYQISDTPTPVRLRYLVQVLSQMTNHLFSRNGASVLTNHSRHARIRVSVQSSRSSVAAARGCCCSWVLLLLVQL